MAAAPSSGLKFEINGLKFVYGVYGDVEFGDILMLAIEKSTGSNDYRWASQHLLQDLTYYGDPSNEKINEFCQKSLAEVNKILARDFPVGGVVNPSTPKEKINAWVAGLMFDSATNQIKSK